MDSFSFVAWKQTWTDHHDHLAKENVPSFWIQADAIQNILHHWTKNRGDSFMVKKLLLILLISQGKNSCSPEDIERTLLVGETEEQSRELALCYSELNQLLGVHPTLAKGSYKEFLPDHKHVFIFERYSLKDQYLIILNCSNQEQKLKQINFLDIKTLLISNYSILEWKSPSLSPWEGRICQLNR